MAEVTHWRAIALAIEQPCRVEQLVPPRRRQGCPTLRPPRVRVYPFHAPRHLTRGRPAPAKTWREKRRFRLPRPASHRAANTGRRAGLRPPARVGVTDRNVAGLHEHTRAREAPPGPPGGHGHSLFRLLSSLCGPGGASPPVFPAFAAPPELHHTEILGLKEEGAPFHRRSFQHKRFWHRSVSARDSGLWLLIANFLVRSEVRQIQSIKKEQPTAGQPAAGWPSSC